MKHIFTFWSRTQSLSVTCSGRHGLDDTQELYYPAIMQAIAGTDYSDYAEDALPMGSNSKSLPCSFEQVNRRIEGNYTKYSIVL